MPSASHQKTFSLRWTMLGLVLPLIVFAVRAIPVLLDAYLPFDTQHTYLPLARRLLEDPSELWHSVDLLKTAPGAFVYMALAGADIGIIKAGNLAMALAMLVMLFDTARRMAGNVAAASVAWFCALSPLLVHLSTYAMVEPPFLFFVTLWLWASTCALELRGWRAIAGVFIAGLALAAATLTRATYMYWLPAAIVLSGLLARFPLIGTRRAWGQLACVHLIALLLVGSYMARNAAEFDKPAVAVGSGAALYFGNNPMLGGQEPPFFGLDHDVFVLTDNHLSIEGDARLVAAARLIVEGMPASQLARLYVHKAGALLFFSKSHLRNYTDRLWRVALVLLAVAGVWLGRQHVATWLLTGAALYQWSVHIPVLYNPRYSVSALELELMLLASVGLSMLWASPRRGRAMAAVASVLTFGIALGAWDQRYAPPVLPDLDAIPHQQLRTADPGELRTEGFDGNPFERLSPAATGRFDVIWEGDLPAVDNITLLRLRIPQMQGECSRAWITYTNQAGTSREDMVLLRTLAPGQDLTRGLLFVHSPGKGKSIRISFECKAGTHMQFGQLGLYKASLGQTYREQAIQTTQENQRTLPP